MVAPLGSSMWHVGNAVHTEIKQNW